MAPSSSASAAARIGNFSAGPAVLPLPVLERAQRELVALPGCGASVLEISHRSPAFVKILEAAQASLVRLLGVPENYHILLLQGGARLQFSMVPLNLLRGSTQPADYILTGSWGKNAYKEAVREGPVRVVWDGAETNYDRLPELERLPLNDRAAYVHLTSNETIQGVQFPADVALGEAPLVCDASSDFLSRPLPIERYGLLYACAQKNAGPAGLTIVIIRDDLLQRGQESLPSYLNYRVHAKDNSLFNTPPTFAIYMLGLVARWLEDEVGGLEAIERRNREKARLLYQAIDGSGGFYRGHARPSCRSLMNVTFRLPDEPLEQRFLAEAAEQGLVGLEGHRSVGGVRASVYNALPREAVEALESFMRDFAARQG